METKHVAPMELWLHAHRSGYKQRAPNGTKGNRIVDFRNHQINIGVEPLIFATSGSARSPVFVARSIGQNEGSIGASCLIYPQIFREHQTDFFFT